MGLMSDAAEWCWLLLDAHGCQAMPIFGKRLAESFALKGNFGSNAIAFVVMKPYQLHPDP
jgi:hypothetical protein